MKHSKQILQSLGSLQIQRSIHGNSKDTVSKKQRFFTTSKYKQPLKIPLLFRLTLFMKYKLMH